MGSSNTGNRLTPARILALGLIAMSILPIAAFGLRALRGSPAPGEGGLAWDTLLPPLGFSLLQAILSSLLALAIGLPGAYFAARYNFPGRKLLFSLSALPFSLPPLLVVLAFILYYGKNGWIPSILNALNSALSPNGVATREYSGALYSFRGLVFIHAFYNFPIVIQNLGSVWSRLPDSRIEAARSLGAGRIGSFFHGSLPYLFPAIIQSLCLIFLFCFFSFTVVLVFGSTVGSTLEVDIYRALRFSNDWEKAFVLSLIQTLAAMIVVGAFELLDRRMYFQSKGFGFVRPRPRPGLAAKVALLIYAAGILVFFIGPLGALALESFRIRPSRSGPSTWGLGNYLKLLRPGQPQLLLASARSLLLSGSAALLACALGFSLAYAVHRRPGDACKGKNEGLARWAAALPLAISSAVTAAGWSALFPQGKDFLIVLGQAALAWPFVAHYLMGAFSALDPAKSEAALVLGASRAGAAFLVELPTILPSVLSALAFSFSMTMGDANIPIVLGGGRYETLPLMVYRLASSYRYSEACAAGLVLALFTSLAFFFKEKSVEPL